MRTTIDIDDHLLRQARERALTTSCPLGAVVDDALRLLLVRESETSTVELPTFGGSGLLPGVDLEEKDRFATLLDDA